jgi:hypothetical protein
MRKREFLSMLVLLLAGAAQAVNTELPLTGPSQQGLLGPVVTAVPPADNRDVSNPPDGVLQPVLDADPDLSWAALADPTASLTPDGNPVGQPTSGLSDAANWAADRHWSTDPKRYTDAGFVNAQSRIVLPAFAEVDWVAVPLPTAGKASLMEIFIFPALGVLVVLSLLVMLIVQVRKRRALNRIAPLLRV